MSKTSSAVKARYNKKAYDQLNITVPKGRRATIEATATQQGKSVNGLVNDLLRRECHMTIEDWKAKPEENMEQS